MRNIILLIAMNDLLTHTGHLKPAFELLNAWLKENEMTLELILIGAFALHLQGYRRPRGEETEDADTIKELELNTLRNQIAIIGKTVGLQENWLNDQSSGIPMPEGFASRLILIELGTHIQAKVASRIDLIATKAAAYVSRGSKTPKDYEDLQRLKPSLEELRFAESHIRSHFSPPVKKEPWLSHFEDSIRDLHALL